MVATIEGFHCTSIKNHFYKMKRDIGMADYEKLEFYTPFLEFHTPSLYLCFFIIGAEQDVAEQSGSWSIAT